MNIKMKILVVALLATSSIIWAADAPKKAPATSKDKSATAAKPKPAELRAWAEEVRGTAKFGVIENEKTIWKKIEKGHEFKPQQFIRTGLGDSYVLVKLSNGCYTEIKDSTKIGISTLFKEKGTAHHNITMKYGSIKAKVEASKGENDFSVTTPRGTLSARGSKVAMAFSGDRGLGARGYSGTWHAVATHTGLRQNIQNGQSYNNTNALASIIASQNRDVRLGDSSGGLSPAERQNLIDNGGGRGVFNFDGGTNNGSRSFSDQSPEPLPVYWTGSGTYYVIDEVQDIAKLYGSGDWTRGEKSGRWEGSAVTSSGFTHTEGVWSGDMTEANGIYKTIDSTTEQITERGTYQGTATGNGTYVENTPIYNGGETTGSRSGTWEGGGTWSGTSQKVLDGVKDTTNTDTGGNLTVGG